MWVGGMCWCARSSGGRLWRHASVAALYCRPPCCTAPPPPRCRRQPRAHARLRPPLLAAGGGQREGAAALCGCATSFIVRRACCAAGQRVPWAAPVSHPSTCQPNLCFFTPPNRLRPGKARCILCIDAAARSMAAEPCARWVKHSFQGGRGGGLQPVQASSASYPSLCLLQPTASRQRHWAAATQEAPAQSRGGHGGGKESHQIDAHPPPPRCRMLAAACTVVLHCLQAPASLQLATRCNTRTGAIPQQRSVLS